jgi:hypothetical protein
MTMCTPGVKEVHKDRILVSRESARQLEHPLRALLAGESATGTASVPKSVVVDCAGVEGVAPSFLDELLTVLESIIIVAETNGCGRSLIVANPPTRVSLKFEAVARRHGLSVRPLPDGSWHLAGARRSRV